MKKIQGGGNSPRKVVARFRSCNQLERFLEKRGVDTSKWNHGTAKSVGELFKEIQEGSAELFVEDGCVVRVVRVSGVIVTRPDGKFLVEAERIFEGGIRHTRSLSVSLSEKVQFAESGERCAARGILEELGVICREVDLRYVGKHEQMRESSSFPGLKTIVKERRFSITFRGDQVRPAYSEVLKKTPTRAARTTNFEWRDNLEPEKVS